MCKYLCCNATPPLLTDILMDVQSLLTALSQCPSLGQMPLESLVTFINMVRHLKERILWNQHSQLDGPPDALPTSVYCFLCDALDLTNHSTQLLWETLKSIAWTVPGDNDHSHRRHAALLVLFLKHGPNNGIGASFCVNVSSYTANTIH